MTNQQQRERAVIRAAVAWFKALRPCGWTPEKHLYAPACNTTTDEAERLARATATYLRRSQRGDEALRRMLKEAQPEAVPTSPLFRDRTPVAAAWQCAMMFAQATEWMLDIYGAVNGKPVPRYVKDPLSEYVGSLVYHCRDLNVQPKGLGGCVLPRLAYALQHPGFYGEQVDTPQPQVGEEK